MTSDIWQSSLQSEVFLACSDSDIAGMTCGSLDSYSMRLAHILQQHSVSSTHSLIKVLLSHDCQLFYLCSGFDADLMQSRVDASSSNSWYLFDSAGYSFARTILSHYLNAPFGNDWCLCL